MKLTKEVEVELTPEDIAKAWAGAGSDGQARIFSAIAEEVKSWGRGPGAFAMQMQYVTDHADLTLDGREVMQIIGDYSHAPGIY